MRPSLAATLPFVHRLAATDISVIHWRESALIKNPTSPRPHASTPTSKSVSSGKVTPRKCATRVERDGQVSSGLPHWGGRTQDLFNNILDNTDRFFNVALHKKTIYDLSTNIFEIEPSEVFSAVVVKIAKEHPVFSSLS